jgi:hypothetical protein
VLSEKEENTAHDNNDFGQDGHQTLFISYKDTYYVNRVYTYIFKITDEDGG